MTERLTILCQSLVAPLVDPSARTFWPGLLVFGLIAIWMAKGGGGFIARLQRGLGTHLWRTGSSRLDLQLLVARQLLRTMGALPRLGGTWGLAVGLVHLLDATIGAPQTPRVAPWLLTIGYTATLFIVWDLSRFLLHRWMHQVPWLWALHQVHHSAEALTPLTFHRVHPIESLLYDLRGVLTTALLAGVAYWLFRGAAIEFTLLGVHGLGLIANAVLGNLRHSHVWMGFGPRIERWCLSPAQHQLHHSQDPAHHGRNYGTWFSVWDRLCGTLLLAPKHAELRFGLPHANHAPDDLVGALLSPLRCAILRLARPARRLALPGLIFLGLGNPAQAQDTDEDTQWTTNADGEMVVVAEGQMPRVAGSAHVIDEAELARHQYNDIHQVLGTIPGVYLRSEDGFGLRPNIGMRGGNSDRSAKITLMEDGVLLSPAPYAAPAAYYFPLVPRLTGVEVIKGAAAIRYGPQTIGGAINLLTRPVPNETIAAIDVGAGLHETVKAHGYAGGGGDRFGVLAEMAHLSSGGFKNLDTDGPTGFDRQDVMLKAQLRSAMAADVFNSLTLKLGYGREMSNETYLGLTAADFAGDPNRRYAASHGDKMRWGRTQATLFWNLAAGTDFDVRTAVYHHRLKRSWTKLNGFAGGPALYDLLADDPNTGQGATYMAILQGKEDTASADQLLMRGTNDRQFDNYGVQSVAHHRLGAGWVQNELELGLRYHMDDVARTHTEDPHEMVGGQLKPTEGDTQALLDSRTRAAALALHLHDDLALGPVHLLPGLRHERITTAAGSATKGPEDPQTLGVWLPGAGLFVEATDWLGLLASVHKGFSPVPPGSPVDTLPETAWNYETGARMSAHGFKAEWVGFLSKYQNLTGQCTLSGGCTEAQLDTQFNGGRAKVYGMEMGLGQAATLPAGFVLNLRANYAYTFAQFLSSFQSEFPQFGEVISGDMLPYIPAHQGSVSAWVTHTRGTFSVTTHGRSSMRDTAGAANTEDPLEIPAIVQVDIAGEYRFDSHWAATITANNVAGTQRIESWRPYGARPSNPRQIMLGLKAKL
jgi:Fe(3+) dicitrate transport protein